MTTALHQILGARARAEEAKARAEEVRFLADMGEKMETVCERLGYPSKEALWAFCKRQGMLDVYHSLPRYRHGVRGATGLRNQYGKITA